MSVLDNFVPSREQIHKFEWLHDVVNMNYAYTQALSTYRFNHGKDTPLEYDELLRLMMRASKGRIKLEEAKAFLYMVHHGLFYV